MAAFDSQYTDLGIVFYADLSPTGKTYVDRYGKTVDCEALGTAFAPMTGAQAVKSATHPVGIPSAHAYWAYVELDEAMGNAVVIRLVSQYGNDAGAAPAVDAGALGVLPQAGPDHDEAAVGQLRQDVDQQTQRGGRQLDSVSLVVLVKDLDLLGLELRR